jgi:hypothetical protein
MQYFNLGGLLDNTTFVSGNQYGLTIPAWQGALSKGLEEGSKLNGQMGINYSLPVLDESLVNALNQTRPPLNTDIYLNGDVNSLFTSGSVWIMDNGRRFMCGKVSSTEAQWREIIPTEGLKMGLVTLTPGYWEFDLLINVINSNISRFLVTVQLIEVTEINGSIVIEKQNPAAVKEHTIFITGPNATMKWSQTVSGKKTYGLVLQRVEPNVLQTDFSTPVTFSFFGTNKDIVWRGRQIFRQSQLLGSKNDNITQSIDVVEPYKYSSMMGRKSDYVGIY